MGRENFSQKHVKLPPIGVHPLMQRASDLTNKNKNFIPVTGVDIPRRGRILTMRMFNLVSWGYKGLETTQKKLNKITRRKILHQKFKISQFHVNKQKQTF